MYAYTLAAWLVELGSILIIGCACTLHTAARTFIKNTPTHTQVSREVAAARTFIKIKHTHTSVLRSNSCENLLKSKGENKNTHSRSKPKSTTSKKSASR
jgi:hypothetical protein